MKSADNQPIDLLIPFVRNDDEVWKQTYKSYCKEHGLTSRLREVDSVRFRNCSLLRYLLRSVEVNAPWINRVYLIVSNVEQVPEWVNKECSKLSIIRHGDFIPQKYLPIFNSEAIEMFLGNIPNLNEHFIYGNDDFLFLNPVAPEDFFNFEDGKIKVKIYKFKGDKKDAFTITCKNVMQYARDLTNSDGAGEKGWWRPEHDFTPMLLSKVKEIGRLLTTYHIHFEPHAFRTEGDYNQYLYTMCMHYWGLTIDSPRDYHYASLKDKELYSLCHMIETAKHQTITVNDTGPNVFNIKYMNIVEKVLCKKFPNKSIFEV